MKKIDIGIIKDFIISILIVICIILIFSIIFYNKISISKVIPKVESYTPSTEMQEELNQSSSEKVETPIITSYYIDAADLKKYEKTQEYVKGKANPFALENAEAINNIDTNNSNIINKNNSINSTSNSTKNTFYGDDGTK